MGPPSLAEFTLDSFHELGAELLVMWDRDECEVTYPNYERDSSWSVQVSQQKHITYLYNCGMQVGIFAHDLQRWFCRRWPGDSTDEVYHRVDRARFRHVSVAKHEITWRAR